MHAGRRGPVDRAAVDPPPALGLAEGATLPDTWSATENVVWKADLPGWGWSSPVVWDNHVFVTATIGSGAEPQAIKGLYDPGDENGRTPLMRKGTTPIHARPSNVSIASGDGIKGRNNS